MFFPSNVKGKNDVDFSVNDNFKINTEKEKQKNVCVYSRIFLIHSSN